VPKNGIPPGALDDVPKSQLTPTFWIRSSIATAPPVDSLWQRLDADTNPGSELGSPGLSGVHVQVGAPISEWARLGGRLFLHTMDRQLALIRNSAGRQRSDSEYLRFEGRAVAFD
jgi:hypothetical protein